MYYPLSLHTSIGCHLPIKIVKGLKFDINIAALGLFSAILIMPWLSWAEATIHHQLHVKLTAARRPHPGSRHDYPAATADPINFSLNAGFSVAGVDPGVRIDVADEDASIPRIKVYRVTLPQGRCRFTLKLPGSICRAAAAYPETRRETRSYLSADGAYLDGNSHWYPQFGNELVTFSMEANLPPLLEAVSQGLVSTSGDRRA